MGREIVDDDTWVEPSPLRPDQGPTEAIGDDDGGRPSVREGFSFAATSFVANAVVGMVSALVTARLYGVAVVGEYAIATAPWLTLIQFSSVAEQVALTRAVSVLPARDRMVAGLFAPVLLFSVLLTIVAGVPIMLLSAAAMRGPINQPKLVLPALVIVIGYVLVDNTSWNIDAVLSAFRAGRELFYARLVFALSFLAFAVGAATVSRTVWALTFATVASFAVALAVRVTLLRRFSSLLPDRASFREGLRRLPAMLAFAVRIVGGRIAGGLNSQADTWILGSMAPVSVVGAYSRASGLAVRLNDSGYRINEILFPTLVQRYDSGDREGFDRMLGDGIRLTLLPLVLIVGAGGGAAVGILGLFGAGFEKGAGALAFLLVSVALTVIAMIQGNALIAVGRPTASTMVAVVRLVVSVTLMFPLGHLYGASGVAGALCIGCVVVAFQGAWVLARVVLLPATNRALLRTIGVVLLAYGASFAAARAVDVALPGAPGTLVALSVGVLAGTPMLLLRGGMRPDEWRGALRRVRALRRR